MDRLGIVVPCYNEEEVLKISSEALRAVLDDLVEKKKIAKDSFVLFVNDEKHMHFSYQRYLENKLRETFPFEGTPIKFILRKKNSQ